LARLNREVPHRGSLWREMTPPSESLAFSGAGPLAIPPGRPSFPEWGRSPGFLSLRTAESNPDLRNFLQVAAFLRPQVKQDHTQGIWKGRRLSQRKNED